jgi:hypothetical protein
VPRLDRAVLDLSALASALGIVPLEAPDVDMAIAADSVLIDLVDLLRTHHDHREADVFGDAVLIGGMITSWLPSSRALTELVALGCARSDLDIGDVASLALARAARLPLVTGVSALAGADPDVSVVVLARRSTG